MPPEGRRKFVGHFFVHGGKFSEGVKVAFLPAEGRRKNLELFTTWGKSILKKTGS